MSDAFMEKFIADLVKGAEHHRRENGGVGVNIEVVADKGREEKLAGIGDTLAKGMGHVMGFGLAHPKMIMPAIGAGLGAMTGAESGGPGHRLQGAAKGAVIGGGLGYAKNLGTEYLLKNHLSAVGQGMQPHLPGIWQDVQQYFPTAGGGAMPKMGMLEAGAKAAAKIFAVDKSANLGGGIGGVFGPIGAALGAGIQDDSARSAGGAALGSAALGLAGGLGGALIGHPVIGALAGGALGGYLGQSLLRQGVQQHSPTAGGGAKPKRLKSSSYEGVNAAVATFGLEKSAFWDALLSGAGSMAAPTAAKWGLGQLAGGAGGKMLGGLAGKILPYAMSSGLAGKAFNAGVGMIGGQIASHLGGAGHKPGQNPPQNPALGAVSGLAGGHLWDPYLEGHMPHGPWQG